jgi:GNAT superfamily N-acetyltransferase
MTLPDWIEEPIAKRHDRRSFDCGDSDLNTFLSQFARQSHEKGAAKTFVAVTKSDDKTILGYYSLCPGSMQYARVPAIIRKGLAKHEVPVFRLGRLAVQLEFQGQGLGGQLLLAAGKRCLLAANEIGGVAMLIDAKHQQAAQWYSSFGAVPLADAPLTLVLPLVTVQTALATAGLL